MHTNLKSRKGHESVFLMLLLLLGIGCSRPIAVPSEAADADRHQAPFVPDAEKPTSSENGNPSAQGESRAGGSKLPFREQENVPAGTLISVRLNTPIRITGIGSEHLPFEGIVVDPVVIDGATLIPQGTLVSGKVESAGTSQLKPNRGYVRLALASVHAGGIDVPVQTASLFARQSASPDQSSSAIGLEKGRRLTFSLSEPVYIATPRAKVDH